MKTTASLDEAMTGRVFTPGDEDYDRVRRVWNGTIDITPAVIARCRDTEDVVRAVEFALDHNLDVSIRGGGHNVAGTALVEDGLVIDLTEMREVEIDADRRVARVQGGATLADVDGATFEYGLVTPSGFISDTGIAGLALKGGMGHTMRRFGLTCDNIVAVRLVTSDGEVRRVTEDDTDLMWALRGGPLDLGVVTEFEFRLHPIESEVRLILSAFPAEEGVEMNRFLTELMDDAPRELGLVSFYASFPDDDDLPREIRDREAIVLFGMYSGDRDGEVVASIVEHPHSLADMGGWMSYPEAQSVLDEEYPDGMRYYWKSLYLDDVDDEVLQIIDRYGRDRPSPETTLDLWTMGGAVEDFGADKSAFAGRNASYMVAIEANWVNSDDDEGCIRWAREVFDALRPYSRGGIYMNFPGSREERNDAIDQLDDPVLERLRTVRDGIDPHRLFTPA